MQSSIAGPSSSSAGGKPDRLYVGNLAPTVDEYTLIQVFQKYGKITKLDYMFHKTGVLKGKPRGYAFIEFSNKDVSDEALALICMSWSRHAIGNHIGTTMSLCSVSCPCSCSSQSRGSPRRTALILCRTPSEQWSSCTTVYSEVES
jgi:hypothetical protein